MATHVVCSSCIYHHPKGRYNIHVQQKKPILWIVLFALVASLFAPSASALAAQPLPRSRSAPVAEVTAWELIAAMNTLRVSYGLPALIEDPIINAVAQGTAEIMAANQMSWHIGDVSGRVAAAGYGGGAKVWATENFAVGSNHTIDTIMVAWSDEAHMIPAVKSSYCHVGAGVATAANGMTYYVLQAAYIAGKSCGDYNPGGGTGSQPGGGTSGGAPGVSQVIVPVKLATPDSEGNVYHVVEAGQSFWAIAVAYQITIKDIEVWNNISKDSKLQIGQKLFIPGKNTKGYATPTPVGMIMVSTPDQDGKVIHTVEAYQTLSTISQAYKTPIETILALNGISADWPLQIGQKLIISPGLVTPSPTPRPLTPIEKLTPENDGKYYHVVQSGETLSWISELYKINVNDLMGWNALNGASILQPNQKLILHVTPPATETPTPGPVTATATMTTAPPTATITLTPTQETTVSPTVTVVATAVTGRTPVVWIMLASLGMVGLFLVLFFSRKRA